MQLLQDIFIVENLQVLNEGKSGKMKIKGIFGRCNEKNNNGRIYPTTVLEGQLKKVQPLINERRLCGELDHPQNDTVKLSNASHLITKLEMKGNELIGEAEVLGTPAGLTAKALIEGGVKIGISSRGMGTLSEDAQGNKIVNEDFRLVTFDLVADPSTRGAFPGLSESTESKFVSESTKKLSKESNFVTMLQDKLRNAYAPIVEERASKKKKSFPDLNKDGEITKADVLVGRGVIPGPKGKKKKMQEGLGEWYQIAYILAEGLGLVEGYSDQDDADSDDAAARTKAAEAETRAAQARNALEKSKRRTLQKRRELKGQGIRGALKQRAGQRIAQGGEQSREIRGIKQTGKEVRTRMRQRAKTQQLRSRLGSVSEMRLTSPDEQRKKIVRAKRASIKGGKPKSVASAQAEKLRKKVYRRQFFPYEKTSNVPEIRRAWELENESATYKLFGLVLAEGLGRVNEGKVKRENKAKKNKNYWRANFPEGQASDDVTPAYNPHGTSDIYGRGHLRGKKKRMGKTTVAEGADAPMKGSPRGVNRGEARNSGESRKASYNKQWDRKQSKARRERDKAKDLKKEKYSFEELHLDLGYRIAEAFGLIEGKFRSPHTRGQEIAGSEARLKSVMRSGTKIKSGSKYANRAEKEGRRAASRTAPDAESMPRPTAGTSPMKKVKADAARRYFQAKSTKRPKLPK